MYKNNKLIYFSILLGISVWILDIIIDFYVFWDLSVFDSYQHLSRSDIFFHTLPLMSFMIFVAILAFYANKNRLATQKLKALENKYELQFNKALDGIVVADVESGIIVDCNNAILKMVGREREELIGKHQSFLHPPETIEDGFSKSYKHHKYIRSDDVLEELITTKDGEIRYVAIKANTFEFNGKNYIQGIFRDITEQNIAKIELQSLNSILQSLIDSTDDATLISDKHALPVMWNKTYARIMKEALNLDMIKGLQPHKHLKDEGIIAWWDSQHKRVLSGESFRIEYSHDFKNDDIRHYEISYNPIFQDREVSGFSEFTRDITDRKKAEEQLKRSEIKYRHIIESSSFGIATYDESGNCIIANSAFANTIGAPSVDQVLSQNLNTIESSKNSELLVKAKEALESGDKKELITELTSTFGMYLWLDCKFIPYHENKDKYLLLIIEDITKRKKAEEELALSDERLKLAAEGSNDGLWDLNITNNSSWVSARFKVMLDYNADELDSPFEQWQELLHPDDKEAVLQHMNAHLEKRSPYDIEYRLRTKQNGYRWFRARGQAVWNNQGSPIRMSGSLQDIHDLKRLREERQISENRLQSLLDNSSTIIYLKDLQGKYILINRQFEKLFKTTKSEIIGKTDHNVFPKEMADAFRENDLRVLKEMNPLEFEELAPQDDGIHIYISIKFPLCEAHDIPYAVCGISTDITERKHAERAVFNIARGISAEVGESFFNSLALHLAETLEADYAYIAEMLPDDRIHARTLALIADGHVIDNIEVDITDTPCQTVVGKNTCSYPMDVQKLFPNAQVMAQLAVEAYIGAPLVNSKGKHIGLMTVMYRKPLSNTTTIESTLQIFAARATAELERNQSDMLLQKAYSELESRVQKRTNDLEKKNIDLTNEIELRKKAEKTLIESEERFRAAAECTADFIWEGNVKNDSLNWIGDIDSCLGYKAGEFPRTISGHTDNIHPEDKVRLVQAVEKAIASGEDFHAAYRIKCKDGSYRYWNERGKAIGVEDGNAIVWVGSVTDFTDKVLLEEETKRSHSRLIHANKMTSLGTIASGVAHEINNPNSYIMSNSQVLFRIWEDAVQIIQDRYDKDNELHVGGIPFPKLIHIAPKLILGISEGSVRINQIIDNLRNFSRPANVTLDEKINVNNAISSSIAMIGSYIQKHTNNFQINCDDSIPYIKGNSQQLEQVIINLTINALQSLKDKTGRVSISTTFDIKTNSVTIKIKDDGEGINTDIINLIKEPFFTTKLDRGGTGLGLSIASTIIKDHQGSMDFRSKVGAGTTVTVSFPVYS